MAFFRESTALTVAIINHAETLQAGNPPFPTGVQFIIASFPALFGSPLGKRVQQWCAKWGWALVWALGVNDGGPGAAQSPHQAQTERVLDPLFPGKGMNATMAPSALERFDTLWATAAAARGGGTAPAVSNVTVARWWGEVVVAVGEGMRLQPMRGNACETPNRCIGLTYSDAEDCVCYH
jgi:hypothetical protein